MSDAINPEANLEVLARYIAVEMTNATLQERINTARRVLRQYSKEERIDELSNIDTYDDVIEYQEKDVLRIFSIDIPVRIAELQKQLKEKA